MTDRLLEGSVRSRSLIVGQHADDAGLRNGHRKGRTWKRLSGWLGEDVFDRFAVANMWERPDGSDGIGELAIEVRRRKIKRWLNTYENILLLGDEVRREFRARTKTIFPFLFFTKYFFYKHISPKDTTVVIAIPHPSGRCRTYNDRSNIKKATDILRELAPEATNKPTTKEGLMAKKSKKEKKSGAGTKPTRYVNGKKVPGKKAKKEPPVPKSIVRGASRCVPFSKRLDQTITVLATENPKKKGSRAYEHFELYKTCTTVRSFLKAGGSKADLSWDVSHRFIQVG